MGCWVYVCILPDAVVDFWGSGPVNDRSQGGGAIARRLTPQQQHGLAQWNLPLSAVNPEMGGGGIFSLISDIVSLLCPSFCGQLGHRWQQQGTSNRIWRDLALVRRTENISVGRTKVQSDATTPEA